MKLGTEGIEALVFAISYAFALIQQWFRKRRERRRSL